MFLGSLLRRLRPNRRQRSQGLVEYGLITACLAFVGIAGFNALADAQKGYLANFPTNATPPSAPGSLLHPTTTDQPVCIPGSPTKIGTALSCTATVHDTFSNPADLIPPWGTLNFYLNGTWIAACALPNTVVGTQSTCSMTWTPWGVSWVGSWGLVATYVPANNHLTSSSAPPLILQIQSNIIWAYGCANDIAALGVGQVEIGHPLRCTAAIQDGNNPGPPVTPPIGTPIDWSTPNGGPDAGVGMFTCATTTSPPSSFMWTGSGGCTPIPIPIPTIGTSSFTCKTDASGACSVVYRRLYDKFANGVGNATPLTLAALGTSKSYAVQVVKQIATDALHSTGIVAFCTSNDPLTGPPPHLTVIPFSAADPNTTFGTATFLGSKDLDIVGAPTTTTMVCAASVYDANPDATRPGLSNNPGVSTTANPNLDEEFPPMGTVDFNFFNGVTSVKVASCTLARQDSSAANPNEAPGQAPFFSSCPTAPFSISGTVGGAQEALTATYSGEPAATPGGPAHKPALSPSGTPGYVMNVDFS